MVEGWPVDLAGDPREQPSVGVAGAVEPDEVTVQVSPHGDASAVSQKLPSQGGIGQHLRQLGEAPADSPTDDVRDDVVRALRQLLRLRLPLRIAAQVVDGPDPKPGKRRGITACQLVQGTRPIDDAGPDPMTVASRGIPRCREGWARTESLALTR